MSAPQSPSYEDIRIRRAEEAGDIAAADYWRRIKAEVDKAPPLGPRQKTLLRSLLSQPGSVERSAA
ncbi:hypothetical protein ACIRPX_16015 [Streptomyces sp. NPDC101225]|uniref:hypothetical protein n=1 Tax=Streptomyces sp. NPDC101225 TaxID=3366135 RepID=UPI00382D8A31